MNQKRARIIIHLVTAAVGAFVLNMLRAETEPIQLVIFVVAYVGLSVVLDVFRDRRRLRQDAQTSGFKVKADAELNRKVVEALGGNDNIETASHDGNRVTIMMKDIDLLDQSQLEALSLDGAVLTGDKLTVSIGPSAEDFTQLLLEMVNKNK